MTKEIYLLKNSTISTTVIQEIFTEEELNII